MKNGAWKMPGWWKGAAAAVYLAATVPFYFLLVQPQFGRINQLKAAQARDILLDEDPSPARVQALRRRLQDLSAGLPAEETAATPLTLTAVSLLARQAGVRISYLEIIPGGEKDETQPRLTAYKFILDGRYPAITNFIGRVEGTPFNGQVSRCVLRGHEDAERAELHLLLEGM